ncbi:unnamed protein product [Candida verbasci]|uniref:Major facilitator superfamily (MFS) profile domain-containing protein n=1 Tax=Candida verbasci TaxID=1227364 RepID=A0A9W4X9A4_9ASCO|nr:unnamed protein product [Candida verbasci]
MTHTFIRDSFFGRIVYHLSKHKYFSHKEEAADYIIPEKYLVNEYKTTINDINSDKSENELNTPDSNETVANPNQIIVTWDSDDDPENPQNWATAYKVFFILEISFLTAVVYMASSIYTPGIQELMEDMQVGHVVATLPLSLFVIGYAFGPLVFSPLSENAIFGRTSIYIVTLFIFCILQIPTAVVNNIAGLCILRFLAGFFASPCLATGGASISDVVKFWNLPVGLATWSVFAVSAPSLGPLIGAALTIAKNYRWSFWFLCWTSALTFIVFLFTLPETYAKTLLYRKARRLRAITGNENITSDGEIENKSMTFGEHVVETLWRPLQVTIMEPVVLLIDVYIAMVYSILYLFFEVFPIYFQFTRHFTLIELGASYLVVGVGVSISCCIYIPIIRRLFTKPILRNEQVFPEIFIPMAIIGACLMPTGLFIFGWTATTFTHWFPPFIGIAIFAGGAFLIFQTLFNYMGASFKPEYLASVFASNDLFRSLTAGAFPLFGSAIFNNLATPRFPVGWGTSVLAFITLAMIAIPVLFYLNGPKLRARSKFAQ